MACPDLPLPGSPYQFTPPVAESDEWAWCTFGADVEPVVQGENCEYYDVTFTYTTRPYVGQTGVGWPATGEGNPGGGGAPPGGEPTRCNDQQIQNPLLEPVKIHGASTTYTEQGQEDRFGRPIRNSAHQLVKGPNNEWDANRSGFTVEQNWPTLDYPLCKKLENRVNQDPIWGFPARSVKLSRFTWRLNLWGTCFFYFTRIFEFEVRTKEVRIVGTTGLAAACDQDPLDIQPDADTLLVGDWDRCLDDVGSKFLYGRWGTNNERDTDGSTGKDWRGKWVILPWERTAGGDPVWPDANNPSHFVEATDPQGNPGEYFLRDGLPANTDIVGPPIGTSAPRNITNSGAPGKIHIEYYRNANFHDLGL